MTLEAHSICLGGGYGNTAESSDHSEDEDSDTSPERRQLNSHELSARRAAFEAFYTLQELCGTDDWRISVERLRAPLPPAFRMVSGSADSREAKDLLAKLSAWDLHQVQWCPGAYRLRSAAAFGPDGQCDATLNRLLMAAQRAGHIIRQETASMLPVLAVGVEPHHWVLELCAAPGSKTMQILDTMNEASTAAAVPSGLLVANDSKISRLRMLVDRAKRVPAAPLLVTCCDARAYPCLKEHTGNSDIMFDRVFCDVPCSGDGTVRKALGLLSQWSPLAGIGYHTTQLAILQRGLKSLKPEGYLAYSTCAINPVECEAVVATALWEAGGAFEVVPIHIDGLGLAEGVTDWHVPAPSGLECAGDNCCKTYKTWQDVSDSDKSGRVCLQRSMFPPTTYATKARAEVAQSIVDQLRRCKRLLPAHDDGGCFFLAVLRRVQGAAGRPRKGERVLVRSLGREAVVREPHASGPFAGLVRIAYPDGSRFHVAPEDLERLSATSGTTAETLATTTPGSGFLERLSDEDWLKVSAFFGFISDPDAASAAGVLPFGLDTVARVSTSKVAEGRDDTVYLVSASLPRITGAPDVQTAGRSMFVFMPSKLDRTENHEEEPWPEDAFPWRPSLEAAPLLSRVCTRRLVRMPTHAVIGELLTKGEIDVSKVGVDSTWSPGAVILLPAPNKCESDTTSIAEPCITLPTVAYIGLLQGSRIRLVTQKGFRLNYDTYAQPCRFAPGTNFRVGDDTCSRWVPALRRSAK